MPTISRRRVLAVAAVALGLRPTDSVSGAVAPDLFAGLRFEIYRDGRSKYRWRLKAGNGRVIATSGEGYQAKADCRKGIDLIVREVTTASIEEVG